MALDAHGHVPLQETFNTAIAIDQEEDEEAQADRKVDNSGQVDSSSILVSHVPPSSVKTNEIGTSTVCLGGPSQKF